MKAHSAHSSSNPKTLTLLHTQRKTLGAASGARRGRGGSSPFSQYPLQQAPTQMPALLLHCPTRELSGINSLVVCFISFSASPLKKNFGGVSVARKKGNQHSLSSYSRRHSTPSMSMCLIGPLQLCETDIIISILQMRRLGPERLTILQQSSSVVPLQTLVSLYPKALTRSDGQQGFKIRPPQMKCPVSHSFFPVLGAFERLFSARHWMSDCSNLASASFYSGMRVHINIVFGETSIAPRFHEDHQPRDCFSGMGGIQPPPGRIQALGVSGNV